MNYEELEVVEIGKAEDVVLGFGVSLDCDNEILLTQFWFFSGRVKSYG